MYWTLLSQSEDDDCILSVAELQGLRIQRSTAWDKIVNVTVRELGVVYSLAQYVQPEITVMMRCHRGITSSSVLSTLPCVFVPSPLTVMQGQKRQTLH